MRVDANVIAGDVFDDLTDDFLYLVRQRAAVGVAQHHPARAFLVGRFGAGERETRVGFVTIEEMLAVEQHLTALPLRGSYAVADRGKVLLGRGLERNAHLVVPGFG